MIDKTQQARHLPKPETFLGLPTQEALHQAIGRLERQLADVDTEIAEAKHRVGTHYLAAAAGDDGQDAERNGLVTLEARRVTLDAQLGQARADLRLAERRAVALEVMRTHGALTALCDERYTHIRALNDSVNAMVRHLNALQGNGVSIIQNTRSLRGRDNLGPDGHVVGVDYAALGSMHNLQFCLYRHLTAMVSDFRTEFGAGPTVEQSLGSQVAQVSHAIDSLFGLHTLDPSDVAAIEAWKASTAAEAPPLVIAKD